MCHVHVALQSHPRTHIQGRNAVTPLQSKLASTSAATLNTANTRPIQIDNEELLTQTDLPVSAASSVEMEELTWTARAVSTRPSRAVSNSLHMMNKVWGGIKLVARDRQIWREHDAALQAT